MMKIIIRFLSSVVAITVVVTISMVLVVVRIDGAMNGLIQTGLFGAWTILGWILLLIGGPFAAVQLWRLRPSGRVVTIVLFANAALYYTVGAWFFAKPATDTPTMMMAAVLNAIGCAFLLSQSAKRQFGISGGAAFEAVSPNKTLERTRE
jgi:hypothetical protein